MVRWERHKDLFRSNSNPPPFVLSEDGASDGAMYTNPSIVIDRFKHVAEFLPNAGPVKSGAFGFYVHRDGTPAIVHLEEIALLVLDLANQGAVPTQLVDAIEALVDVRAAASMPGREALLNLLEELESLELLVCATLPNEPTASRNIEHEGIKQGYIPLVT